MALLILFVSIALFVSFVCSILEAVLLSVSLARLGSARDEGSKGAGILAHLKQHRLDDAISAVLTLNTIAHTIGAALAGFQAAKVFGDQWVGLFSAILTLLILVITEIIPKTLGAVYSLPLAGIVGYTLQFLVKIMYLPLFFSRLLTQMIASKEGDPVTRSEIEAMLHMAAHQGSITAEQSTFLRNLLAFEEISIADVMTPRTVVGMMQADTTIAQALELESIKGFSRIPLYGENFDDVKGYVIIRQLWASAAKDGKKERKVIEFNRKIEVLPKSYSVSSALRHLTKKQEHLAMVLDEFGGISGLVTLEDLFETLLGIEIMDELDQVIDMRQRAKELRDQRLARMESHKEEVQ